MDDDAYCNYVEYFFEVISDVLFINYFRDSWDKELNTEQKERFQEFIRIIFQRNNKNIDDTTYSHIFQSPLEFLKEGIYQALRTKGGEYKLPEELVLISDDTYYLIEDVIDNANKIIDLTKIAELTPTEDSIIKLKLREDFLSRALISYNSNPEIDKTSKRYKDAAYTLESAIKENYDLIEHFEKIFQESDEDAEEEVENEEYISCSFYRRFKATEKFTKEIRAKLYDFLIDSVNLIEVEKSPINCTKEDFIELWDNGDSIGWFWDAPQLVYLLDFLVEKDFIEVPELRNTLIFPNVVESGNQFLRMRNNEKEKFRNIRTTKSNLKAKKDYTETRVKFLEKNLKEILLNEKINLLAFLSIIHICESLLLNS